MNVSKISYNGYNFSIFYGAMLLKCPDYPLAGASEERGRRKPDNEAVPGYNNESCQEPGNTC
jgi:hypothetical protein